MMEEESDLNYYYGESEDDDDDDVELDEKVGKRQATILERKVSSSFDWLFNAWMRLELKITRRKALGLVSRSTAGRLAKLIDWLRRRSRRNQTAQNLHLLDCVCRCCNNKCLIKVVILVHDIEPRREWQDAILRCRMWVIWCQIHNQRISSDCVFSSRVKARSVDDEARDNCMDLGDFDCIFSAWNRRFSQISKTMFLQKLSELQSVRAGLSVFCWNVIRDRSKPARIQSSAGTRRCAGSHADKLLVSHSRNFG